MVLDVLTPRIYKIQKGPANVPVNVHVDHLKPYESSAHPRDWTVEEIAQVPSSDEDADSTLVGDGLLSTGDTWATVATAKTEQEPAQVQVDQETGQGTQCALRATVTKRKENQAL